MAFYFIVTLLLFASNYGCRFRVPVDRLKSGRRTGNVSGDEIVERLFFFVVADEKWFYFSFHLLDDIVINIDLR